MMYRYPTTQRVRGVTLVEMMVALAITTFVILVINKLFNEVIQTVGRGTQAGEILQRSRAFDEQIASETQLIISGGRDPANNPYDWFGRMVGPAGRESGRPGGFFAIIQRVVNAPLTIEDSLQGRTRLIRSDQLIFIYDQRPLLDDSGKKRLPPLAPSSDGTYGGDMRNSINADYVRMWYGHAVQLPADPSTFNITNHDLGVLNGANPNAIAQDWVLGRHALFLTDSSSNPGAQPYGAYTGTALAAMTQANVIAGPSGVRMYNGITDVANITLNKIINAPGIGLNSLPNTLAYQGQVLSMMFTSAPLQTSAKPVTETTGVLSSWDVAPSHSYFMGGVSDFIVEWAGDVVRGVSYLPSAGDISAGPDGELDRDPEGRIKWYTWAQPNRDLGGGNLQAVNPDLPVTYPVPNALAYAPFVPPTTANFFFSAPPPGRPSFVPNNQAAFVWQHQSSTGFTQWPWMIRIRYRLHDRRGEFEGRQVTVNAATGETEPEPGAWFETIIPVNYQGVK
jgi:pilin/secretion family protein with methylation motif